MKLDAIVLCIKVTIPPSVSRLFQLSLARVTILFLEQVSQKLGGQMNWGSEAYYGKDVDPPGEHLRNFSSGASTSLRKQATRRSDSCKLLMKLLRTKTMHHLCLSFTTFKPE